MTVELLTIEEYQEENRKLQAHIAQLETDNQALQQALHSSTIFFERSTELLCIINFDGLFTMISPAWTTLLGYEQAEIINQPFAQFLHPDDIEITAQVVEQLQQGYPLHNFENRYQARDGSYRTLLWNGTSDLETRSYYLFSRDITEQKEVERARDLYIQTIQQLPYGISIYEALDSNDINQLILRGYNSQAKAFLSHYDQLIGKSITELYPNFTENLEYTNTFLSVIQTKQSVSIEQPYSDNDLQGFFSTTIFSLPNQHIGVIYEEITERKRSEEALRQAMLQEEIINAQKAALDELSTPLIPISDNILVMPLIGTMDTRRAQQVMDTILYGLNETGSGFLIIDITGVTIIDTQVANAFIRAAHAAKLLGAQVLLTGIRPEVAQTLVGLGIDLSNIITCSSLQRGIAQATSMQK
jgi:rsbT co-antagonist protein RsbR